MQTGKHFNICAH